MSIECRLKNIRRKMGLTQEELADHLGVSRQAIISLEAGRNMPSIPLALSIAEYFRLPVEVIFYCETENKNQEKGDRMDREIMPWSPWREMASMREALDRMFDESVTSMARNNDWNYPALNVRQTNKEVIVEADVPGMKQEDIDIEIGENSVSIRGERKATHEENDKKHSYYHREVNYGAFHRAITLPVEIDADKAKADLEHGTLVITLPKVEPAKPKTIKLKPRLK